MSDGMDYLIGIQREAATPKVSARSSSPELSGEVQPTDQVFGKKDPATPPLQDAEEIEVHKDILPNSIVPKKRVSENLVPKIAFDHPEIRANSETSALAQSTACATSQHPAASVPSPISNRSTQPEEEKQATKKGKSMRHKWLDSALWNSKQSRDSGTAEQNNGNSGERLSEVTEMAPPPEKTHANDSREFHASVHTEAWPLEDIYCSAGIMNPRKGYGISKVIEMLQSDHLRGLSKDMQRAAVLTALNAAGIRIEEILVDARARQIALDAYEARQTKLVEAEIARKAEQLGGIEAELDRVKEQYAARIIHHQEAMDRERAAFNRWQLMKQEECQNMAEAAELCLKSLAAEPVAMPRPATNLAIAGAP
jgi:hypothetical protein